MIDNHRGPWFANNDNMARSSSSTSPPATMQCQLDFPVVQQLHLAGTWSIGGRDFEITRMLHEYEARLAGLVQGPHLNPCPTRKLPKKRHRPTTHYPNKPSIHTPHTQAMMLYSRLDKVKPELEPIFGRMDSESEDLDSLLLEAARLASLEELAIERGALNSLNSRAETPTISNGAHLEAHRMTHTRSSTSPVEYNAHGCITVHSKGKGRAD
ncbi:hypothetical protein FRC10_012108 [Ceratobasidium sp. 414]|nr:hypothetical protein FRC10_012108 [Ceratobasidium sp. 414]